MSSSSLCLDPSACVALFVGLRMTPDSVFLGEQRVARYNLTRARIGSDLGTTLDGTEVQACLYTRLI